MISKIEEVINSVVGSDKKFLVSASDKSDFGHYSTNVAFSVKENPAALAEKIKQAGGDFFEKTEAKGKFINLWISRSALAEGVVEAIEFKQLKTKGEKINLEFISANPTGPLTMANGRGGFWGDVLANVLELAGHEVTREYYINDAGNQIRLLGESVLAALGKAEPKEEHYRGEYIKEVAEGLEKKVKEGDAEQTGRMAAKILLKQIQESLKAAGINFDVWFSEYENLRGDNGLIGKVLAILEKSGLVEDKEGARWLKTSEIADDKDRVLVKSDGQPTYFLADLAYHYDKFINRKFDKAIDIWGADHHGYIARLKAGVKALGFDPEKLKIIITQLVRLVEGGEEKKMSKRKGEFVTLDELIKDVGPDAARFFFLLHTPESHMDFDLALAKERSAKNPVYYAQYAYVRCGSILEKAGVKKVKGNWDLLKNDSELALMRELVKLPDVVWQSAGDYNVSRLARYAMDIARRFHDFYEKERVIEAEAGIKEARLALVAATREILAKLFKILGISAPEKM